MTRYSPEFREQVARKIMPPNNQSVASIHRESGISTPSLYAWKRQFQEKRCVVPAKISQPDGWDNRAKLAAVIESALMNEAERSTYCRERGLYVEQLDAWKAAFEQGEGAGGGGRTADVVKKSPGHLGHRRGRLIPESMKQMTIVLIDEAVSCGALRHKACQVLGITCRTLRLWRRAETLQDKRKGAPRTCPHALNDEEKETIVATCNLPQYQSLPPGQIIPRLADESVWIASESSYYRVLAEHDRCHRRGRAKAPRNVSKPKALAADIAKQVWSWDITYLPTAVRGQFDRLYMVLDIYSRKIVGWEIHGEELATHTAERIDKACRRERIAKDPLMLHAHNGGPIKGATMLATLQKLGVVPSFSRPSVSDDNPYSEALFRTLKYTPAWPKRPFQSLDEARQWVLTFVAWYNTEHRHSGIRFVTPQQRHEGTDTAILAARADVYEEAKANHPNRWRGRAVRDWTPIEKVWLNPDRESSAAPESERLVA